MIFVLAILLAIFVLPSPWGLITIGLAGLFEIAQMTGSIWWSQRRHALVGAEALVGQSARVVSRCAPRGTVSVRGEIWNARCVEGAEPGDRVRVTGLDGLTLLVDHESPSAAS
jgi:membrane-bound serine protease (ClpP class)